MTIELMIYLAEVSEKFKIIEVLALFCSLMALGFCIFIYFATCNEGEPYATKTRKNVQKVSVYLAIFVAIFIFTPSSTTIYMIAGASAAKEVAKSEIGEKVYKLINKKLDELNEVKQ